MIKSFQSFLILYKKMYTQYSETLESKLLQQVADMRQEVLHEIFLNIHKAYYALYWGRALVILEGYRM